MAAQETSALFSLSELMRLEQNRIAEEEEQRKARIAAEENARREAERLARERERARLELEEERRRLEAERDRERAARLEAIRQAEIERARVEAEQRARLETLSAQQQHEQKLVALQTDAKKKSLSRALRWTIGLSATVAIGAIALYFGRVRPQIQNEVQGFELQLRDQRLKSEANQRALDWQNQQIKDLEERVKKEQDQSLVPSVHPEPKTKSTTPSKTSQRGIKPPAQSSPCKPCADPHDPLCDCFNR